jgi:tetratricopeptide (TPR) repeat protein
MPQVNTLWSGVVSSGMGPCVRGAVVSLVAFQIVSGLSFANPTGPPRGELVDAVVSPSDPTQRYVLFVPESADLQKPTPILYVMDNRGRGRVAAEVFRAAAERFGWIVMSSYNTVSDGPAEPNAIAFTAMWKDSHDRFPIDDRRIYLAGISGTARMATLIARGTAPRITGVIGAAAGFHKATPPSKGMPFLYYGTAGTADYNYWEMRGLEAELTRHDVPHRIAFFDGPHTWMPPNLALAALAWMELRAMQAGHRAVDPGLVEERWTRDLDRSRRFESEGRVWEASHLLAEMASDYMTLRPAEELATVARRARELGATPAALEQPRRQVRAAKVHLDRVHHALQVLADAFPEEADVPVSTPAKTILDMNIAALRQTAAGTSEDAFDARRVLAELDVQTGFYLPVEAMRQGDDERARFYLGIAEAVNPDDAFAWYLRAAIHARRRQTDKALAALERAVALGFRTVDALDHDASFNSLRRHPDFVRVLDALR